jgi:ribosomal protein S18 acetylase RimI-like enzyme
LPEPSVSYSLLTPDEFDVIRPLWEQLNQHHASLPTPFAAEIALRKFEPRRRELCEKAHSDGLRIEVARMAEGSPPVAYGIATLSADGAGEIDSLFVLPECRRMGIASMLMQRALDWLRESGAKCQRVVVLHGNEEALAFYRRFGFSPRNIELQQLPPTFET